MTTDEILLDDRDWELYTRAFLSMLSPDDYVRALCALSIMLAAWRIETGICESRGPE